MPGTFLPPLRAPTAANQPPWSSSLYVQNRRGLPCSGATNSQGSWKRWSFGLTLHLRLVGFSFLASASNATKREAKHREFLARVCGSNKVRHL